MGIFAVARLFEISFGSPGPAVLKAATSILLPPAIGALIGGIVGHDSFFVRMMVSSLLTIPLTWFAFWWLFQLDFDEALWLDIVIWIISEWVLMFLLALVLNSGDGSGLAGVMGGGGGSSADQQTTERLAYNDAIEAREWLGASTNRIIGMMSNTEALEMVDRLYKLGAEKVTVIVDGSESRTVVVTLPKDKEKRKKLFEWQKNYAEKEGEEVLQDEKQKYFDLYFSRFVPMD
ncbi:MAG: hypothetical protein ACRD15_03615 [Vicinamibacterales bacterium]